MCFRFLAARRLQGVVTRSSFSAINLECNDDENIARQVAEYLLHAATYLATLPKVED